MDYIGEALFDCKSLQAFLVVSAIVGMISVLNYTYRILKYVWRHFLSSSPKHKYDKYKKTDSYAVVTGGSDGIGLEICHQMAAEGFNICIVARNEKKMQEKLAEIVEKYGSHIKTKYVIADFSKMKSIAAYKETIAKQLADIDIAILFVNAGFAMVGCFHENHDDEIERMIDSNVSHVAYTTKVLVKQMIGRNNPGAIVITASQASTMVLPAMTTYSATKAFDSFFAEGLYVELAQYGIDVLSW